MSPTIYPSEIHLFSCPGLKVAKRVIDEAYIFVPIILDFFVIIEILVILFRGFIRPAKEIKE